MTRARYVNAMRIAVMAAGAVGGYFGGRLAAAGHDVSFIARGAQLEAIRNSGLTIESPLGNLHLKDARATSDPKEVGPVDVVLFAVKLWDTEAAAELARPLVGGETRVITLQNGIDSVERLAPILGADNVAGGSAYISSVIAAPGVISHTSQFAKLLCGRLDRKADAPLAAFVQSAKDAGIDVTLSDDMERTLWEKFVFLVGFSGATGAMRSPLGPIMADPDTRDFFRTLMAETIAVASAKGVAVTPGYLDERMKFADAANPGSKASLLNDLERGNRTEIDWLAGKVTALGRELGVPTPANAAVYTVLKLHRMGRS